MPSQPDDAQQPTVPIPDAESAQPTAQQPVIPAQLPPQEPAQQAYQQQPFAPQQPGSQQPFAPQQPYQTQPGAPAQQQPFTQQPYPQTGEPAPQYGQQLPRIGSARPPKPVNTKLVVGLIAGGLVVALAIIAAIVLPTIFGVSKADYRTASTTVERTATDAAQVSTHIQTLYSEAMLSSSSSATGSTATAQLKRDLTAYAADNAQINELKAQRDSEFSAASKTYAAKAKAFTKWSTAAIDSAPELQKIGANCTTSSLPTASPYDSSFVSSYSAFIQTCQTSLSSAEKSADPDLAKFAKDMNGVYDKLGGIITQISALGDLSSFDLTGSTFTQLNTLEDELYALDFDAPATTYEAAVTNRLKAVDPTQALSDLNGIAVKKAI